MNRLLTVMAFCILVAACSSTSAQRAGEGALTGAAAGAVGSMFAAAIFGGDVGNAAARGAAWGAGAGAVSGAVQGSQEDARRKEREAAETQRRELEMLNALRDQIGPDTFSGLEALTDGKHQVALAYARTAMDSGNSDYALAAHWLEALAYQDHGDLQAVSERVPRLVELDPEVTSIVEATEVLDELVTGLQEIRAAYG